MGSIVDSFPFLEVELLGAKMATHFIFYSVGLALLDYDSPHIIMSYVLY